jgi:hypothetical protein
MELSISSRREQLGQNIRRLYHIRGSRNGTEDIEIENIQLEGGIATVYEKGTTYEIVKYSFVNPNDDSEMFEVKSGSSVTLKNDIGEEYHIAQINYLYFYNDEEDNVHIEANFESLEDNEVPNWASLGNIVHVCRSDVIE